MRKMFRRPNFLEPDGRLSNNPSPHFITKVEEKNNKRDGNDQGEIS